MVSDFDPSVYGAAIAGEYDELYEDELQETDAAVGRLALLAHGGPVLEFGIGTGRLALPLAATGVQVRGVEASLEMVDQLRNKAGGGAIEVAIGDFTRVEVGRDFALVVLAFNTIFALPDQQAQVDCFANAARHLRPGGIFVVEAWVPDLAEFRHNRLVRPRIHRSDRVSIEVVRLDPVAQMMETTQTVLDNKGVRLYPANHRYAWPAELDLMARLAGMRLTQRWEDWQATPFSAESRRHISVYARDDA
ncbi:MAG: class I SAM-dependent methyltransferase [Actinobacteria bacterium]|nr:class I SAM-dependent methyltransferase [Actinomycetota bacterium]MBW3649873.1 class I SAM-dependent methyltransferase [Actinomycetota bacterium]